MLSFALRLTHLLQIILLLLQHIRLLTLYHLFLHHSWYNHLLLHYCWRNRCRLMVNNDFFDHFIYFNLFVSLFIILLSICLLFNCWYFCFYSFLRFIFYDIKRNFLFLLFQRINTLLSLDTIALIYLLLSLKAIILNQLSNLFILYFWNFGSRSISFLLLLRNNLIFGRFYFLFILIL